MNLKRNKINSQFSSLKYYLKYHLIISHLEWNIFVYLPQSYFTVCQKTFLITCNFVLLLLLLLLSCFTNHGKKQKFEAIKFAAVNDCPLKFVELFLENGCPRTKTNGLALSCNDMTWEKAADELVRSAERKNPTGKLGPTICSGWMENCKLYV